MRADILGENTCNMNILEVISLNSTLNQSSSEAMCYWKKKNGNALDIPEHTSISTACGHTDSHKSINSEIS